MDNSKTKTPSFHERAEQMKQVAIDLVSLSDLVHDEAERMLAAAERFAQQKQKPKR